MRRTRPRTSESTDSTSGEKYSSGPQLKRDPITGNRPRPAKAGTRPKSERTGSHRFAGTPGFGVEIIYEDDTIIVIDKPEGLLSVATEKETQRTAFKIVRDYLSKKPHKEGLRSRAQEGRYTGAWLGVVHRLDRDTSGIMMFVKTEEAQEKLRSDWAAQVTDRRYLAVVENVPDPLQGTIHNWLKKNAAFRVYELNRPEPEAEEAITDYKVVSVVGRRALVELELGTGRSNQIRVHMAGIGCPVVGDTKYGLPGAKGRLALHACRLAFTHPKTGELVKFESELPVELKKQLSRPTQPKDQDEGSRGIRGSGDRPRGAQGAKQLRPEIKLKKRPPGSPGGRRL